MKIKVQREGRLIEGHVLDCARAPLLEALKRYDPLLYLKWNKKKRGGRGVWEVRRRAEEKTALYAGSFQGQEIYTLEYRELDLVNHVLDVEYLNYDVFTQLKKMDMWQYGYKGKDLVKEAEYLENKYYDRMEDQAEEQRDYTVKQHKTLINDFKEFVLSGGNPYRLADHWNNGKV